MNLLMIFYWVCYALIFTAIFAVLVYGLYGLWVTRRVQ